MQVESGSIQRLAKFLALPQISSDANLDPTTFHMEATVQQQRLSGWGTEPQELELSPSTLRYLQSINSAYPAAKGDEQGGHWQASRVNSTQSEVWQSEVRVPRLPITPCDDVHCSYLHLLVSFQWWRTH